MHSIRHTHCSYLLHNDVSIYYISKRLGHKNIKTTMDVYSHLLDEVEQKERKSSECIGKYERERDLILRDVLSI